MGASGITSLYSVKKRINANAWESERKKLRDACVQTASLPDGQICIRCSNKADIWCRRCRKITLNQLSCRVDALQSHTCDTRKDIRICCLDEDGTCRYM